MSPYKLLTSTAFFNGLLCYYVGQVLVTLAGTPAFGFPVGQNGTLGFTGRPWTRIRPPRGAATSPFSSTTRARPIPRKVPGFYHRVRRP